MVLGREDLLTLAAELPEIHVDCEFCGKRYAYDQTAVDALLAKRAAALH
jgi:redox-regulated HSP33 family molecular chaperone